MPAAGLVFFGRAIQQEGFAENFTGATFLPGNPADAFFGYTVEEMADFIGLPG